MTTIPTLRALLEKATKGPLFFDDQTQRVVSAYIPAGRSAALAHVVCMVDPRESARKATWTADGELIAEAINALPQLLAIAEKAKAVVWYDCSDNDSDFVADVEALRQALTALSPTQPEARQ